MPDSVLLQTTMVVVVSANLIPTFDPRWSAYCRNATAPAALPTTSTNTTPITGTWAPAFSTATVGTTTYTFTPDAGQCATQATMDRASVTNLMPDI